ncbi:MAG: bifunctional diguanylate cyclase/phosphodiesterase, partial [Oleiagrimonas sp.]|nr:bifunctional diguanylate cyclase/phosphodiesterase [Oleiagrimonas sp.]
MHKAIQRIFQSKDAQAVADVMASELRAEGYRVYWHAQDQAAEAAPAGSRRMALGTDPLEHRVLEAWVPEDLDALQQDRLQLLQLVVDIRMRQQGELAYLFNSVSQLGQAERLQRALYAIADQASTVHDMDQTLRALHAILGTLMYAENFYIALYDNRRDAIRFAYYVDINDTETPPPNEFVPMQSICNSVTWHLIREGRPLYGN